ARRHGLTVELSPTPGHGVTASVEIPPRLYAPTTVPAAVEAAAPLSALPPAPALPSAVAADGYSGSGARAADRPSRGPVSIPTAADAPKFRWFPPRPAARATPAWNAPTAAERLVSTPGVTPDVEPWPGRSESEPAHRGGLNRRVPGQHGAALIGNGEAPARPA